jgi:putative peptide zinc metalloprotease protein
MSQTPERSRYRRFTFASADRRVELSGDFVNVVSVRLGRAFRLTPQEFELARLFDGTRDAVAVRAAAAELGQTVTDAELRHLVNELAQADLLVPGYDEPMPVIPQTDAEAALIGTPGFKPNNIAPPSTAPGSLTGPGLPGSVGGSNANYRGDPSSLAVRIPLGPFIGLGYVLALPSTSLILLAVFVALFAVLLNGIWIHRDAVGGDFTRLLDQPWSMIFIVAGGVWLQNLCTQLARAAAVRAVGKTQPDFGLTFFLGFIPWFSTLTSGAVERASRGGRIRVAGSTLAAQLMLISAAIVGYFLTYRSGTFIAPICIGIIFATTVFFFVSINPLTRRDGYFVLTNWLEIPDLREQSAAMVFGLSRPWQQAPTLSPTMLVVYALLCAGYMVFVCYLLIVGPGEWLSVGWGATGVVIFLALVGLLLYDVIRRTASRRGSIGNIKLAPPSTWIWIIGYALAALSLIPYTFEPSGEFQVLPYARADIRALTSGDVRQVMVHEGDKIVAGQVLAKLGDEQERAAVDQSKADLQRLEAQLALLRAGGKPEQVSAAEQQVETARTHYKFSRAQADRIDQAFKRKAVSQQERDRYVGTAEADREELESAERHLAVVKSPAKIDAQREVEAQMLSEQVQLKHHEEMLAFTEIRSPIAGRIISTNNQLLFPIGIYLNRGDLFATVEDSSKLYAQILMPEIAIGEVKIGQLATIKAAAYPGTEFTGKVIEIAPDAQAQQQHGSGTSPKVVRVLVVVDDPDNMLRPQMTGQAKVEGHVYPAAAAFFRPFVRFLLVEVWSWLP